MKISRIGVVTKNNSPVASRVSQDISTFLKSSELYVLHTGEVEGMGGEIVSSIDKMNADLLVVVGGDGTVMRTAQQAGETPILGVKVGALGFLCETTPDTAKEVLEKVIAGKFYLEHRTKLKVNYLDAVLPEVLNEVVVATSKPSKILSLVVLKDGEPIHKGRADGVIISTTTGSTAYSLSAGGPIIDPKMDLMEVIFICPLSAGLRPLIFPCSSRIEVRIMPDAALGMVILDGRIIQELAYDVPVVIERSEHSTVFVRISPSSFYKRIREKIKGLEV